MNIEPTAEQQALVEAVAGFLREQLPVDRFVKAQNKEHTGTDASWSSLVELGLLGIALPESVGGIELGLAEEVLLYREAGRYLVSPSLIATNIAAKIALARGDEKLCGDLVNGAQRAALAVRDGEDKLLLIDSEGCTQILLIAEAPVLLQSNELATGVMLDAFDQTVSLIEVKTSAELLAKIRAAINASSNSLILQTTLLIATYLTGVARAACDTAVAYAGQREQFGRPIGSFQAIAHICSEMAAQSEAAAAQTLFAALVMQEEQPEPEFHVASAQLLAVRAALLAARQGIQVHGGVGFTQEYTPHLFLKRAHLMERLLARRPIRKILLEGGTFS
ncbi:MAG: acyl-CoA dehydrogenase family protein [Spongiibacteraceae bacterium]